MQPAFFLAGNHARNGVGIVLSHSKICLLLIRNLFSSISKPLVTSNGIKSRKEHEIRGNEI